MTADLLPGPFGLARPTIEEVLRDVMVEARRRADMSPTRFAEAINELSSRRPGLYETSVEMFEAGISCVPADILCIAMELAGHDVIAALTAWVRGTSQPYPLRQGRRGRDASATTV